MLSEKLEISKGRRRNAKFSTVTVSGIAPKKETVKKNVQASTLALKAAKQKLARPGVSLSKKRGIPRYFLDENNPTIMIRVLNGRVTRGRIVNGSFIEI